MEIKKELVFIGCSRYDFEDEKTGRKISGAKVFAVDFTQDTTNENRHGFVVSDFKAPYELFSKLELLSPLKPYPFLVDVVLDGKKVTAIIKDIDIKA